MKITGHRTRLHCSSPSNNRRSFAKSEIVAQTPLVFAFCREQLYNPRVHRNAKTSRRAPPYVHSLMVCTLGSLQRDKVFTPDAGELVARLLCSEMLAVNVAFTNTQPTPDGRQAGSWELRPTTPRHQPAICGIFDQSYLAGIILATRLPMTCGSCSPEEPSSV